LLSSEWFSPEEAEQKLCVAPPGTKKNETWILTSTYLPQLYLRKLHTDENSKISHASSSQARGRRERDGEPKDHQRHRSVAAVIASGPPPPLLIAATILVYCD